MNPYTVVPPRISQGLKDWQSLLPEPLSGDQPLRTARLMLAAAVLSDMPEASLDASADFLRETALIRRVEWQQRLQFLSLLPRERPCERVLLALFMLTELTAAAAQRETHPRARAAMDFLLPEACDMLYRTANLLSLEYGVSADEKLGGMAELMPGRPCIAAHRHPYDEVQPPIERAQASPQTLLSLFLLSCAARYAARLSAGALGESREHARALYAELSLILTEHATQYASRLGHAGDPCEALTLRAYSLCYVLDGLRAQEEDAALRAIYDQAFYAQCAHLHKARRLYLRAHEGQEPPLVDQELPPPLILQHGGRDHSRSWDWVAEELRHDWHVICPDLRGHGDSAWSADGNYSFNAYVYDFAQLVHTLGYDKVWTEPVTFPKWERRSEHAEVIGKHAQPLTITALGGVCPVSLSITTSRPPRSTTE